MESQDIYELKENKGINKWKKYKIMTVWCLSISLHSGLTQVDSQGFTQVGLYTRRAEYVGWCFTQLRKAVLCRLIGATHQVVSREIQLNGRGRSGGPCWTHQTTPIAWGQTRKSVLKQWASVTARRDCLRWGCCGREKKTVDSIFYIIIVYYTMAR